MANSGIKAADFANQPFNDWKQTVSRTAIVRTVDFYGDETITDDNTTDIEVVLFEVPRNHDLWNKFGLVGGADGIIYVLPSETISKDDKITANNKVYRLD